MNASPEITPRDVCRTLFVCELEQCSSLSIGGNDEAGSSDMPLLRAANGDFLMRGSSLAGALIATARTLTRVPQSISRGEFDNDSGMPSSWEFDHAFVVPPDDGAMPEAEIRPGAPHRQDTRTTADGGLHDIEVLPPQGQRWRFLLEVPLIKLRPSVADPSPLADDVIAALALREWSQGRCWLGRKVSRGLGWMRLSSCRVLRLKRTHVDMWPDSSLPSLPARLEAAEALAGQPNVDAMELAAFVETEGGTLNGKQLKPKRRYLRWTGKARTGEYHPEGAAKSYGLDTLAVGGHAAAHPDPQQLAKNLAFPGDVIAAGLEVEHDMTLAMFRGRTSTGDLDWMPYLPGTSASGAFRHWSSACLRRSGERIWDPVAQSDYSGNTAQCRHDIVELLLGTRRGSGADTRCLASALLFRDAHLSSAGRDNWSAAYLERVALDPYLQKAASGRKFNGMALLNAEFQWQLVLELELPTPDKLAAEQDATGENATDEQTRLIELVELFLQASGSSRIGFGGGEFRGHGHLAFAVDRREEATAGDSAWREVGAFLKAHASDLEKP